MNSDGPVTLVLENLKTRSYIRLGFAFMIMNALTFVMFLFLSSYFITAIAGLAVILIYFLIKKYEISRKPEAHRIDENLFFVLAAVWLNISILIGILLVVTGILLKVSLQKFQFVFSREGIIKDFYPKKKYDWQQIDSVILRAGMLTINFKNSHLIQGLIENPDGVEEAAFNALMIQYTQSDQQAG